MIVLPDSISDVSDARAVALAVHLASREGEGPATQAELAHALGWSVRSVGRALAELKACDVVRMKRRRRQPAHVELVYLSEEGWGSDETRALLIKALGLEGMHERVERLEGVLEMYREQLVGLDSLVVG